MNGNDKEYDAIRRELVELKKCITDYMGFVFSGSGLALVGLSVVSTLHSPSIFVYAPLSISVILLYVLLVLYYKFGSHNLQAGYCKLLNKEKHQPRSTAASESGTRQVPSDISAWEWCLELLRSCDETPLLMDELIENLPHGIKTTGALSPLSRTQIAAKIRVQSPTYIVLPREEKSSATEQYRRDPAGVDRHKYRRGARLLLRAIALRGVRSASWRFPAWVTMVFFILDTLFYAIGVGNFAFMFHADAATPQLWAATGFATLVHAWVWMYLLGRLFCLLEGSSTIDAAYWRFIPIRNHVLNQRYEAELTLV